MAPKESRIPAVAHNPISSVSVLDGDVNTSKIPGYKQSQLRAHGSVSRMQNNIPAPGQIKLSFGQASPSDAADHSTSAKCAKNNWKEICTKTNPQAVQTIEVRAVGGTVEMDQEDPEGSKILIAGAHMQEGSSCQIGKMGKPTRLPSRALCKMSRISSEANATAKKSRLVLPSGATGVHKCSVEVPPAKCEKLDPDVLDVNTPQAVLVANPKQMALAVPSSEARDTIITLQPGAESAPLRQCEELMVPVLSHDTKDEENRLPSPRLHHAFDEACSMSLDTTEWLMDQGFPTSNDLLPSVYRPCDPQVFPVPAAESVRTGFEVRNTEYVNSRATLLRQSAVPDTSLAVANVEQSKSSQQVSEFDYLDSFAQHNHKPHLQPVGNAFGKGAEATSQVNLGYGWDEIQSSCEAAVKELEPVPDILLHEGEEDNSCTSSNLPEGVRLTRAQVVCEHDDCALDAVGNLTANEPLGDVSRDHQERGRELQSPKDQPEWDVKDWKVINVNAKAMDECTCSSRAWQQEKGIKHLAAMAEAAGNVSCNGLLAGPSELPLAMLGDAVVQDASVDLTYPIDVAASIDGFSVLQEPTEEDMSLDVKGTEQAPPVADANQQHYTTTSTHDASFYSLQVKQDEKSSMAMTGQVQPAGFSKVVSEHDASMDLTYPADVAASFDLLSALHAVAEDAPMDVKQPEQPLVEEYSQETGNMIVNRAMVEQGKSCPTSGLTELSSTMERDGTLQDASLDLTYPGDVAASLDGISIKFAENLSRKRNPDEALQRLAAFAASDNDPFIYYAQSDDMMFNAGTVDALSVEDCMPASKHTFNVLAGSHSPMQDFNTQSTVESVMDTVLSSDPMVERLKFSFVELQEVTYHGIPAENSAAEMAFLDSIVGDLVQDAAAGSDMVPASFANPSFMAPDDGFRVFASAGSLHVCAEASCNVIARKAVGDEVGDEDSIDVMMAPKPTITPAQDESGAKASSGPALNSMGILFSIQADQECVAADEPMKPGVVREPVRSSFDNDQGCVHDIMSDSSSDMMETMVPLEVSIDSSAASQQDAKNHTGSSEFGRQGCYPQGDDRPQNDDQPLHLHDSPAEDDEEPEVMQTDVDMSPTKVFVATKPSGLRPPSPKYKQGQNALSVSSPDSSKTSSEALGAGSQPSFLRPPSPRHEPQNEQVGSSAVRSTPKATGKYVVSFCSPPKCEMSEWSPSSPDTHNTEVDAAAVPAVGESESPETVLRKSGYGNPFFIKNSQADCKSNEHAGSGDDIPEASNPLYDDSRVNLSDLMFSDSHIAEDKELSVEMTTSHDLTHKGAEMEESLSCSVGGKVSSFKAQTPWRRISDHAVTISAVEDWEPDELTAVLALCIRYQLQPDWEAMLASDPLEDMMSSIKDHHRNAVELDHAAKYLIHKRNRANPTQKNTEPSISSEPSMDASLLPFKERMAHFRAKELDGTCASPPPGPSAKLLLPSLNSTSSPPSKDTPDAVSVAAAKLTTEVERRKSTQADGAPCSRSRVFAPKISAADGQKDFGAEDEKAAEIPDRSYETTGQVVAPSCDLEQEVCWERSILTLSSSTAAFSSQEVSREQLPCSETLASLVEVVEEDGLSDAEYPVNHSEKAVVAGQTPPVLGAVSSTTVALDSSDDPANGAQGLQEVLFQNNWTRANSNFEHDGEELDHFLSVGLVSSLPGAPATTGRTPLPRPMTSGGASPVEGRLFPRIHGPGYKSALDDSRSSDSSDEPTASVVNPWSDLTLDTSFDAVVALKDEPLVLARTRLQSTPNNSDPAVGAVAATSNQEVASEEGNQPNDALTWIAQRHMNSGSSAVNSGIDEEFVDCDDLQVGCNIWPNSPGSGPAYLHPVQTETNPGFSPAGSMYFDCETPLGTPVHLNPVPKVPEAFSGAGHELDQARLGRPFPLVSAVEAEHVVASCAALFCLAFKYQIALGSISENTGGNLSAFPLGVTERAAALRRHNGDETTPRLPTHPSPNESLGTASHERTAVHSGRTREPETLSRSLDEEDLVREILGESTLACSDGEDGLSFEEASKPRVTTEWGAAMASDLEAVTAAIQSRRTTLEDIRRKAEEQMIEPHSCGLAGEAQQNDMVEVFTDIHVKDEAKAVIEQANGSMQEPADMLKTPGCWGVLGCIPLKRKKTAKVGTQPEERIRVSL